MSNENPSPFARAGTHRQAGILVELFHFLRHSKKFWLMPLLLVLLGLGVLIILGGTTAAPFIYTLF